MNYVDQSKKISRPFSQKLQIRCLWSLSSIFWPGYKEYKEANQSKLKIQIIHSKQESDKVKRKEQSLLFSLWPYFVWAKYQLYFTLIFLCLKFCLHFSISKDCAIIIVVEKSKQEDWHFFIYFLTRSRPSLLKQTIWIFSSLKSFLGKYIQYCTLYRTITIT